MKYIYLSKIKEIIILLLLVNFFLLLLRRTHWSESPQWSEYLTRLSTERMHQNIINFPEYCKEVNRHHLSSTLYFNAKGIPISSSKILYSDFTYDSYTRKVLLNHTKLVMPHHFTRMNSQYHPWEKLYPEISLFFVHEPAWHDYHQIGLHFLCDGQRYNHIPGNHHLNFKDETANRLQEYSKTHYAGRKHCFSPWEITPFTYDLSDISQCRAFFQELSSANTSAIEWVVKKSRFSHNGQGLTLLDSENKRLAQQEYANGEKCNEAGGYIAQRYISDPFLIKGRKFDFRAYMLIASMDPLMILFHDGFVRVTLDQYNSTSSDLSKHLTNLEVAEGYLDSINATEEQVRQALDEQGWGYDQLERYMVEGNLAEEGWMQESLRGSMKRDMLHIVRMNLELLLKHPGVFELFGLDFVMDRKLHLWFIETNLTPCVTEKNEMKRDLNSKVIEDIVDMEYALLHGADFDAIVKQSGFQWVFDDRKTGIDKYHGLLEPSCI